MCSANLALTTGYKHSDTMTSSETDFEQPSSIADPPAAAAGPDNSPPAAAAGPDNSSISSLDYAEDTGARVEKSAVIKMKGEAGSGGLRFCYIHTFPGVDKNPG